MTVPNVSINDSVKVQNMSTTVSKNTVVTDVSKPDNLQRQPQEDTFNGKSNKKKILIYTSIGTVLAALIGVALDFKFADGKHVKKLWNKQAEHKPDVKPKSNANTEVPKTNDLAHENQAEIDKQVEEFFKQEEKELAEAQKAKELSDKRNEIWLEEQHAIKEKEYSDFWNRALEEEEKFNRVDFNIEIKASELGNNANLDWYLDNFKQSAYTRNILEECKDLTFDTPNLKLIKDKYDADNIYDLGLRYAIVANNTAKAKGSGALIKEIPEIFRGIDEKELVEKLDLLPALLDLHKINTFTIGGKKFQAKLIGSGCIKDVYKITDSANNQICYVHGRNPYLMHTGQGFYNEFAILNEANNAGVVDVPKLYMGNPVGYYAQNPNQIGCTTKGAWEIVELVEPTCNTPDGLTLFEWLKNLGLYHGDVNGGTCVGGKVVDLGGICDSAETINLIKDDGNDIGWLFRAYYEGKTTKEIIEYIDKYSK